MGLNMSMSDGGQRINHLSKSYTHVIYAELWLIMFKREIYFVVVFNLNYKIQIKAITI